MDSGYTVSGFELSHLIVIFILLGCALFVLYWLWVYPGEGESPQEGQRLTSPDARSGRVISPAGVTSQYGAVGGGKSEEVVLYAMEIEPGTVVLQSQNGDLFRILREYDSVTHNGVPTSGLPAGTSHPVHYVPSYTRAHVQNYASAPPYTVLEEDPPPFSPSPTWSPLCIHSASTY